MKNLWYYILVMLVVAGLYSCQDIKQSHYKAVKVAFMADVHLQNIYGELSDSDYKGVKNPENGKYVFARTMQSQLNSTRIFNENYFAFLAALEDAVKKGIKYVVLPGDFSDDGQPINVKGLKEILQKYERQYGLRFLLTTGNHDPVRPFLMDAGKKDFLGEGGKSQPIMSKEGMYKAKSEDELNPVITKDIAKMGYKGILNLLKDYGLMPDPNDIYWETPFSEYSYKNYNYTEARKAAQFENRQYIIPPLQTKIPDVSYLVEPEEGVWFLAIDANVYVPRAEAEKDSDNPKNYNSASIGYNKLLSHKNHIIDWVKSVTERAEKLGKTLVVFSHYPLIDFNDDASEHIKELMGDGKMQLHRVPKESVAKVFAEAGVKVHFGGHLHINDTSHRNFKNGASITNIQIPSLAAYIPAYKIADFSKDMVEVETIIIDSVPNFKELFPLYELEHEYLESIQSPTIWNKNVLSSQTYHEFTNWHLKELVRLRFLEKDWPKEIKEFLLNATGRELSEFSGLEIKDTEQSELESWTGLDMIFDFYRLRSADKLAIKDIGIERVEMYQKIIEKILNRSFQSEQNNSLKDDLKEFAYIFNHFLNGDPANHFVIDLKQGTIRELK
ncbi:metallophosphoesterase [Marinifilum sp.]|uniref:metallophosphoesterase n=1 Tax=Marinifilum sp. TaxID=2033137 RepID=UPI003BAB8D81